MAVVLTYAAALPVVKVGRIAGQFAKPRSSPTEKRTATSCRAIAATSSTTSSSPSRRAAPDPARLIEAFRHSAATLNLLRAFVARRLCQPRQCPAVDARLRQGLAAGPSLRGTGRPDLRGARLHAGLRARPRKPSRAQEHRLLHQPRGAAARLRAGDDARGLRRIPARSAAPRRTCCGSATAPASPTMRMSSSAAASSIRSASSAARRPRSTSCCA